MTVSWDPGNTIIPSIPTRKYTTKEVFEEQDIYLTISVHNQRKTLFFEGVVGDSNQLLLYSITPGRLSEYSGKLRLSQLSEEIQLKLYDYMETLGTGDGMANFIAEYNSLRRLHFIQKQLSKIHNNLKE